MKIKNINLAIILVSIICTIYIVIIKQQNLVLTLKDLSIILTINMGYIVQKIFKIKIDDKLNFIYILFIFMVHFLGVTIELYNKVYWFDKFAHFLSGILSTILGLIIIIKQKKNNNNLITILFILSFASLIASMWEIFEYTSSCLFDVDPQRTKLTGVNDTMIDIIVATLGSMLVSVYYYFNNKKVLETIKNV